MYRYSLVGYSVPSFFLVMTFTGFPYSSYSLKMQAVFAGSAVGVLIDHLAASVFGNPANFALLLERG